MRAAFRRVMVGAASAAIMAAGAAGAQDRERPVAMPAELAAAAAAFQAYTANASAIDPKFRDGRDVADALKVGAGYEAHQLQVGMVAYAAMAALEEPDFVRGVRQIAR